MGGFFLVLILGGVLSLRQEYWQYVRAAQYQWTQTTWHVNLPDFNPQSSYGPTSNSHLTGWQYYASSSPGGLIDDASGLKLKQVLTTISQTDDSSSVSGFNYPNQTQNNAVISGSGDPAMITLSHSNSTFGDPASYFATLPPVNSSPPPILASTFSPNGKYLFVADSSRRVGYYTVNNSGIDANSYTRFSPSVALPDPFQKIQFTPNGKYLIGVSNVGVSNANIIAIPFNQESGVFGNAFIGATSFPKNTPVLSLDISSDGEWLVAGLQQQPYLAFFRLDQNSSSNPFSNYFPPSPNPIETGIADVAFNHDHSRIAIAKNNNLKPIGPIHVFSFNGTANISLVKSLNAGVMSSRSVEFAYSRKTLRDFVIFQNNNPTGMGVFEYNTTNGVYFLADKSIGSNEINKIFLTPDRNQGYTVNASEKAMAFGFNVDQPSGSPLTGPKVLVDPTLFSGISVNALSISPDGNIVAVSGASGVTRTFIRKPQNLTDGTFTSGPILINSGSSQSISGMSHSGTTVNGKTVSLSIRVGDITNTSDASWTPWVSESSISSAPLAARKFFQYEAKIGNPSSSSSSFPSPALYDVSISYARYPRSAYLISSMFRMTSSPLVDKPAIRSISWKEKIPSSNETVDFQLQSFSSFSSTPTSNGWLGPDGSSGSTFSSVNTGYCQKGAADASGFVLVTCLVPTDHPINQTNLPFIQYRVELGSVTESNTPTVSEVSVTYGINSSPTISAVSVNPVNNEGTHVINFSVSDSDNPPNVNVGVFYDIGLRLETDPGPAGNTVNIKVPNGESLPGKYLPPDGMIAIDNEIIEYHHVGGSYISTLTRGATSATSLFKSTPSTHLADSIIWVRANDSDNAMQFSRIPASTVCASGSCIGSGVSLGAHQVSWTPKGDIPGDLYLTDAKVRIIANDQEIVRNISSGASSISAPFALDTRPPKLTGTFNVQNADAEIPNQGYKIKGPSATLALPGIDAINDNSSADDKMFFCGGESCGSPTASALLGGTAGAWIPTGGFAPASSYAFSISATPQQIHLAVIDNAGNVTTRSTASVVSDTVAPPASPSGSFKAQDISSSLGRPAVYLTWDPLVWSTQLDGFGRQDFKSYRIFRDNVTSCGTPTSFCEIASIGTGQTTSFADEAVSDGVTYNYLMQVEDDAGNVSHQITDAGISKTQVSVSLTGGPVIEPLIQNTRFVPQASYTDPITFYWDTVQEDDSTVSTAADSYVAYYKSSSFPTDPTTAFENAPTQGSAQQKSVGVVQADGDCACHKVTLVGLESGEKYFFQLRSTLGAKTATHIYDINGYTMLPAPPKLIPVISDVTPADHATLTTPTKATITWNTKYPSTDALAGQPLSTDAFIEYGLTSALGAYTGKNESRPDHSVDIVGLQPNTTYYYQIHSKVATANGGEGVAPASGAYSFTTAQMAEDKVPPTISNEGVTQQFGTSVTVEWDTDEQASSITEYWDTANPGIHALVEDDPGKLETHHTTHVNNLTPNTPYTCRVISLDAANNRSQSNEFSCDTGPAEVLPDPIISNIHNDAPGPNNVVIYWDTDNVISNSVVFYSEDPGLSGALSRKNESLANGHEITLVGLTPGKEYFYKVKSSTAGSQTSAESSACSSGACKFQTPLAGEDPPRIVAGSISVTPQEHSGVITWRTSKAASSLVEYGKGTTIVDGNEVPTYDGGVYGDNGISTIDGGQAHSVTLPANLVDGETYYFRVISYDSLRQLGQFPEGDPTSIDSSSDAIPSCSTDRYNCLNPSFDTIASALTQEAETKEPLTITNVLPLAVTNVTAVVGWNTNRVADSCVIYGPSSGLGSNSPLACDGRTDVPELKELTRTHAVTLKDLQPDQKYYFKVVSRNSVATQREEDSNGTSLYTFTTTKGTGLGDYTTIVQACPGCVQPNEFDTIPPVLSDAKVSEIDKNTATITWTTDEDASSIVQYGETEDYEELAGDYTVVTDHTVKLKNLLGGTKYVLIAVSYDASGNRGESDELSFTTLGTKADKPKPEDEEEGDQQDEEVPADQGNLSSDQKNSIEKILEILKGLSDEDASKVLEELGLQLVAPPKFVEGRPQIEVTQTSATITWMTDKDADSRVAYIIGVDYSDKKQDPYVQTVGDTDNFTKQHEVTIAGLEPGTLYHYQIRSRERAGRTAYAPDRTFRTSPIKPDIAKVIVKDITEHAATFIWKTNVPTKTSIEYANQCAKDVLDCKAQKLTQGDSQLIKTHQFVLKDLASDTEYIATIRSEDENGLQNISKPVKFHTGKDTTPPELSQVRTKLSLSPGKEDAVQAVISWKTSEPADTQVFYAEGVKKDDLIKSGESSPLQLDNTTNHVVVLNKLRPGTVYRFRAVSKDPAGNSNVPKEFKIITPRKEESVLELIIKNFEEAFGFLKGGQ